MKLLLVDPPELFLRGLGHTRQVQPLGLAYVGAAVADLAEVRFLLPDTRAWVGDDPWAELVATIVAEAPDLIGLTAVTATFPAAAELAQRVRAVLPDVPIVLGGVHASTLPAQSLEQAPAIDWLVVGEGEQTLRALVLALDAAGTGRQLAGLATIDGLWWRDADGRVQRGTPRAVTRDVDTLRPPLRTGLVWSDDVQPAFYQAIITQRGCPYHCIYCAVPNLDDTRTRSHSAERVVDEIVALQRDHGIDYLFFHDSVFTLSRKRTLAICDALERRGVRVPFCIQTRADRVDAALLARLRDVGLHQVFYGIETGTAEGLRQIRKEMPLATIREAVAQTRAVGVRTSGFFMVGWPWEDEAAIDATIAFATSLDLDAVSLFSATPLPGTELHALARDRELPRSIDFRTPQVNLTGLDDARYAAAFARASAAVDAYNQQRLLAALDARVRWHELPVATPDDADEDARRAG